MAYNYKFGKAEQSLLTQIGKNGGVVPEFLKNKPTINYESLYIYLQAFHLLESERLPSQYAVMPIPITKIIEYAKYLELGKEDTEIFIYVITELDNFTVNYWNSKNAQSKK